MRSTRYLLAAFALVATFLPGTAPAIAPGSPGLEITQMTGSFGINGCSVRRSNTGLCFGTSWIYSTYEDPLVAPNVRCDSHNVFPVGSGWETKSGTGNCEIATSDRLSAGTDTSGTLSVGSFSCAGFRVGFDYGAPGNIYYFIFPDGTGDTIRFGKMTGYIASEAGPFESVDGYDDYEIYMWLQGNGTSPTGRIYKLSLELRGHAYGEGSCWNGSYNSWDFAVAGRGYMSQL